MDSRSVDSKEVDFAETMFVRDIENHVFQSIIFRCLNKIDGISLQEGGIIDTLLGTTEKCRGIIVEQDQKQNAVFIKLEVNIRYGISIPQKAEEIQNRVVEEVCSFTGLHVSCVHVVFKNLICEMKKMEKKEEVLNSGNTEEAFSETF
jgi:uncharacterized alkaline shock family protein YloU